MVSPHNGSKIKNPIIASNGQSHKDDKELYDMYITIKHFNIFFIDDISKSADYNVSCARLKYKANSRDMYAQPEDSNNNFLLRYTSEAK